MNIRLSKLHFAIAAAILVCAGAAVAAPVYAHGFGTRYDLPIPLNYFMIGAAAAVAASFVVIGFFVNSHSSGFKYPRVNLLRVPVVGAVISSPVVIIAIKVVALFIFGLTIVTAFFG